MKPVQREEIDAFAHEGYDKVHKKAAPPSIGTIEAARLLDRREFIYRGRAYSVAPIPWHLALEILDVREKMDAIQKRKNAPVEEMAELFQRAAHLSKKVCRPVGLLRRMLWRISHNPFMDATPYLMGRNLGFFSTCLALDSLDVGGARPQAQDHGESLPTSRPSSVATRPGSRKTASRSRGRTSSLAS